MHIPLPQRRISGGALILSILIANCGGDGGGGGGAPTLAAPSLDDAADQTYTADIAITNLVFANGGGALTACSGALPAGLTVERTSDNATCQITGTPTSITPQATYAITATNATGSDNATVAITIHPPLPSLVDADARTYTTGMAIPDLIFNNTGGGSLTGCTIRPALPAGLNIERTSDNASCQLTGTPTEASDQNTYTVTATNAAGDDDATVGIAIVLSAPSLTDAEAQTFTANSAIANLIFTNEGGGSLTGCTIRPNPPEGLTITRTSDNATCQISGTPTAVSAQTAYTVTATNPSGSDTSSITISIIAPPSAVFLPDSVNIVNREAELGWTAPATATSYEVWRAEIGDGEIISRIQTGVTATSYTDTTLAADTDYYYLIAECTVLECADPSSSGPTAVASVVDDELDSARAITTTTIGDKIYALVAASEDDGMQILDISDPSDPLAVGSLTDDDTTILNGAIGVTATTIGDKTYALVVADSETEDGLQIIDISDPSEPMAVGSLMDTSETVLNGSSSITTFTMENETMEIETFALVTSGRDDGIQIIDITRPSMPIAVGSLPNEDDDTELDGATDAAIAVINGKLYAFVAAFFSNSFHIIDISDPTMPESVGSLSDEDVINGNVFNLNRAFGVTTTVVDGKTYALVTALIGDLVQFIDVSDPTDPRVVATVTNSAQFALNAPIAITTTTINGKTYALVTTRDGDGVQIIDISEPSNPEAGGSISEKSQFLLDGAYDITTLKMEDKTYALVAASEDDGMQIIDISDPVNPKLGGSSTDISGTELDDAQSITTTSIGDKTYALVGAFNDDGIQIIDISDPVSPELGGSLNNNNNLELDGVTDITTAVINDTPYALVTSRVDNGVQIIDISDPSNPRTGDPDDSTVVGGSLTDGNNLELDGASAITTTIGGDKTYALVAVRFSDVIQIIDVSDPADPSVEITISTSGGASVDGAYDIVTTTMGDKTYALVSAQDDNAVQIIDVSDPTNPSLAGSLEGSESTLLEGAQGITTAKIGYRTYAFVVTPDTDSMQIIDITDPSNPRATGSMTDTAQVLLDGATNIATATIGNKTYALIAASEDDGIQIIDVSTPQRVVPATSSP